MFQLPEVPAPLTQVSELPEELCEHRRRRGGVFEPGVRDATRDLPQVPGSDIIAANRPLEILGLQQVPRGAALHVHPEGGRGRAETKE